jgi:signal transduction histidine kinase
LVAFFIKLTNAMGNITLNAHIVGNHIEVSIADDGVGIPETKINRLFNIDTNITTKGTDNESGTGLGLILCKEFIEKHGEKIWVKSEFGKGSRFKFTLSVV